MTISSDIGSRLSADGREIALLDGHRVTIRYGMKSLLRLEEMFGSLSAIDTSSSDAPIIGNILRLISAGLVHEKDSHGAPLTVDRLADLLDPRDFQALGEIAAQALGEAFPTPPAEETVAVPSGSLGTTGSTPPLSRSDAAMSSSGA
jgi:hypothetical protein